MLGVPIMGWVAGIFLYWWWVFLFKGNKELEGLAQVQDKGIPGISSLKDWNTLHQAMSTSGGDIEEMIRNDKKAKIPMLVWYGGANILAIWICCPITLGSLEITQGFGLGTWLAGVVVWAVLMLAVTPLLLRWGSKTAETAYLSPLGLAVTQVPGLKPDMIGIIGGGQMLIPDGPAIVEGERHGRLVHIETLDQHCLTVLQARLPEFTVNSEDGKLVPEEGAPDQVTAALESLRKAKRWRGVQIFAGPQGIAIQRQSEGTNMWLYDLWLAEYLLDKINTGGT